MVVSKENILDVYKAVLNDKIKFSDADEWAWNIMQKVDERDIQFLPHEEENLLWKLITYLYGIDIPSVDDRTRTARNKTDIINFLRSMKLELNY